MESGKVGKTVEEWDENLLLQKFAKPLRRQKPKDRNMLQ